VVFDLAQPNEGRVIGNTALTDVGSMDFFGGQLWAASGRDDKLSFHTIDLKTGESTWRSVVEGRFSGVSGGSFDDHGSYWVINLATHKLQRIDPRTGVELHSLSIPASAGYNGVAFVGETLYAVRGGTGDPPQEFGKIDLDTGEFTTIGYTNVGFDGKGGGNGCGALDYDPASRTMYLVYRQGMEKTQRWSLYTLDMRTGLANFVNEIGPKATYDAFAIGH
jgi:hypothetical protein